MFGSNVIRAVITTAVAVLVLGGRIEIWHLVLAGALFGTVDAVFFPAIGTIVARLVPEDRLGPANSVLQGTQQLMQTVGPAVARFAVAFIGVGWHSRSTRSPLRSPRWRYGWCGPRVSRSRPSSVLGSDGEPVPVAPPVRGRDRRVAGRRRGSRASRVGHRRDGRGARVVLGDRPVMRILVLHVDGVQSRVHRAGRRWSALLVRVGFGGEAALLGLLLRAFGGRARSSASCSRRPPAETWARRVRARRGHIPGLSESRRSAGSARRWNHSPVIVAASAT